MKKTYNVHIPVYAYVRVKVEAENEEEALEKAEQELECRDLTPEWGETSNKDNWDVKEN